MTHILVCVLVVLMPWLFFCLDAFLEWRYDNCKSYFFGHLHARLLVVSHSRFAHLLSTILSFFYNFISEKAPMQLSSRCISILSICPLRVCFMAAWKIALVVFTLHRSCFYRNRLMQSFIVRLAGIFINLDLTVLRIFGLYFAKNDILAAHTT